MSRQNFSEIKKNVKSYIENHFSHIDKKNYFPKKDFEPSLETDLILIGLHVVISDQIHQFLKCAFNVKVSTFDCESIGGLSGVIKLYDNKLKGLQKVLTNPSEENIKKFLEFFGGDSIQKFKIYKPCRAEPYSSFEGFNRIYKSRNMYVHDARNGVYHDKLQYHELKSLKSAVYQFMDDIISILNLPTN